MTTRFAFERYCVQSNNGNAKPTTSKIFANIKIKHCVKSVRIRSYSGPYFPAFGLNTERYSVLSALERKIELWESRELMDLLKKLKKFRNVLRPTIQHQTLTKYEGNSVATGERKRS